MYCTVLYYTSSTRCTVQCTAITRNNHNKVPYVEGDPCTGQGCSGSARLPKRLGAANRAFGSRPVNDFQTFCRITHHELHVTWPHCNMPKRKRGESEAAAATTAAAAAAAGNESGEDQGKSIRQRRVEQKLDHGRKLLSRAFKVAKGFERQKLSRRRKTAAEKSDAKEVVRIDAEAEATKVGGSDISDGSSEVLERCAD